MIERLKKINTRELIEITIGVIIVAFSFYFLLSPAHLVTGGVTGLSIIFEKIFNISNGLIISLFILIANLILLAIGGIILGRKFFYKTVYGTIMLPLMIAVFELIPLEHHWIYDKITDSNYQLVIVATIGALLTGFGLGLVFKNNATTGGTDVIQRILYEKLKVPFSVAIYLTDGIIIALGFIIFGIEQSYFAVIAIIISGTVVDKLMLSGRSGYTVFIVTNDYLKLKEEIYLKVNRGITKIEAVGGFSDQERDMIICTISKNQLYHLKAVIQEKDPHAFTFITKTYESVGQGFN